jgi:hypothetical protein
VLLVVDVLLVMLIITGSSFRSGLGAGTDMNSLYLVVMIAIILSSLIVRYVLRKPGWSTILLALPFLAMFILYLLEEKA